jgi:hypothetical protein
MAYIIIVTILAFVVAWMIAMLPTVDKKKKAESTMLLFTVFWLMSASWEIPDEWQNWVFGAIAAVCYLGIRWVTYQIFAPVPRK